MCEQMVTPVLMWVLMGKLSVNVCLQYGMDGHKYVSGSALKRHIHKGLTIGNSFKIVYLSVFSLAQTRKATAKDGFRVK
jgi:hypothetical protein